MESGIRTPGSGGLRRETLSSMNVDPGNNPHQMLKCLKEGLMAAFGLGGAVCSTNISEWGQPLHGVQPGNSATMNKCCQKS